jgi:hypothetical protein
LLKQYRRYKNNPKNVTKLQKSESDNAFDALHVTCFLLANHIHKDHKNEENFVNHSFH